MRKPLFFTSILLLLVSNVFAQIDTGNSITVVVENFESNDGKAFIGLYDSSTKWLSEAYRGAVVDIENEQATCVFNHVPDGVYAVSMYHDENGNDKLDKNYIGIPKESYGCSRGARGIFGPPNWTDAQFAVEGSDQEITIKL